MHFRVDGKRIESRTCGYEHRDRVRGISLRRHDTDMAKILRALSRPFPELESLEIGSSYDDSIEQILPPMFSRVPPHVSGARYY